MLRSWYEYSYTVNAILPDRKLFEAVLPTFFILMANVSNTLYLLTV